MSRIHTLLTASMLALAGIGIMISAARAREYPYCSYAGGLSSHMSCGFSTWEQCQASVRGAGAHCTVNPAYSAAERRDGSRTPMRGRIRRDL